MKILCLSLVLFYFTMLVHAFTQHCQIKGFLLNSLLCLSKKLVDTIAVKRSDIFSKLSIFL